MNVSLVALPPVPLASPPKRLTAPTVSEPKATSVTDSSTVALAPGAAPALSPQGANPWPELERLGVVGATAAAPGPLAHTLTVTAREGLLDALHRLEAKGVSFERQRGVRVPGLMDKYVPLSAEELVEAIADEPSEFKSQFNVNMGQATHIHLQNVTDLQLLDAYAGLGPVAYPARAGAVEAMHDFEAKGWTINAYNYAGLYDSSEPPAENGFAGLMALVHRGSLCLYESKPGTQQIQPHVDKELLAAAFFDGGSPDHGLKDGALAQAMRDAEAKGFRFGNDPSQNEIRANAREAYQAAIEGHKLYIGKGVQWSITVTPDEMKNLASVEPRMKTAEDVYNRFAQPTLAGSSWEHHAPSFVDAVVTDSHVHALDVKAAVMAACVKGELECNTYGYAVSRAAEDMRRLLDLSPDPGRVLAYTAQFVAALKTSGRDNAWEAMTQAHEKMRARAGSEAQLARMESHLMQFLEKTHSIDASLEGANLVRISVGTETEEERVALFLDIAARESDTSAAKTASDYEAVLVHRLPSETMLQAGARMLAVLDTLSLTKQQDRATEVFATIQEGAREGRFGQRSPDEILAKLGEVMVTARSLDDALSSLTNHSGTTSAGPSTVETGDGYVIIGGIRIPRSGQS